MTQTAVKTPVITTRPCGRCGGSGHYSYCERWGTICFGCGGSGKVACAPKGQKKIPTTVDRLDKAKVGDIISLSCVLYQVVEYKWIKITYKGFDSYNQQVKVVRLIDGKTMYVKRGVYALDIEGFQAGRNRISSDGGKTWHPSMSLVCPTEEMIGQVVEEEMPTYEIMAEVNGLAIMKIEDKFELRMRNENGLWVYVPGYTKAYARQSAAIKLAKELTDGTNEDEARS